MMEDISVSRIICMEDNNIRYVDTAEFFTLMTDCRTIRTSLKTIQMYGITYKVDIPPEECVTLTESAIIELIQFTEKFLS